MALEKSGFCGAERALCSPPVSAAKASFTGDTSAAETDCQGRDMAEATEAARQPQPAVSEEQLRKAEAYVEAEEGAVNRLVGWAGSLVTSVAVAMSLFHLYAAIAGAWPFTDFPIIATQPLRYAHVAFVLMLSFLLFPLSAPLPRSHPLVGRRRRHRRRLPS